MFGMLGQTTVTAKGVKHELRAKALDYGKCLEIELNVSQVAVAADEKKSS